MKPTNKTKTAIESGDKLVLCDSIKNFPFKTTLSLESLVEFWKEEANHSNPLRAENAKSIVKQLEDAPELLKPVERMEDLEKHSSLIDRMMTAVYPPSRWESQISTSNAPFSYQKFYSSPLSDQIFNFKEGGKHGKAEYNERDMLANKILTAYLMILKNIYGKSFKYEAQFVIAVNDGILKSFYKIEIDPRFSQIKPIGKPPKLGEAELNYLLEDAANLDRWREILPPEKFEFVGFVTITAVNVTEQESLSQLKYDLLEQSSIVSMDRFLELQQKLRNFLRIPELKLGLVAFGSDWNKMMDYGSKIGDSFIMNDNCKHSCETLKNSIYAEAFNESRAVIVEDLTLLEKKTVVEKEILNQGIKNIIIALLYYQDELVGLFELGSPNKGELNSLSLRKLNEVLSLFSIAVKRSLEEMENKVQAVIKEECTAIHPAVEWRFEQAALNLLHNKAVDESSQMEEIVFDNLFPLYGLTDIRDSSIYRNESIQADLIEHLTLVKNVLSAAHEVKQLPILDELNFRTNKYVESLLDGLSSGDEISIMNFLSTEIDSVFSHIQGYDPSIDAMIRDYQSQLDSESKVLYRKRKDYEDSVIKINDVVSTFLDEAQAEAQQMYPHYFEKYKTDGVEHSIYIGESLVQNQKFNPIYLKNLRLWQLIVLCGVAGITEKLKPELKVKLDTTHLVLVQNNPLSIRFRYDEKKFDVDGTYNLRYEIMKKRIDKAIIKGSRERLTMPGKIAVVYSQQSEAQEYRRYFEYLISKNYINGEIEELELEALQGVQGLRALRIAVNHDSGITSVKEEKAEIEKAVKNLAELVN